MGSLEYLYQFSRIKTDENGAALETYTAARLVQTIKDGAPLADDAAIVLLRLFLFRDQLPEYFTDDEIQRYFSQLPG